MRQLRVPLAGLLVLCAAPLLAHGQDRGQPKITLAGKAIAVDYGRPALKGRDVWKDLVSQLPVGETWSMGANQATTLTTEADLQFGSVPVPKGSYVLRARRVDEAKWSLQFTKPPAAAGESRVVVAEAPLSSSPLKESVELLTIELRGEKNAGELEMKWGATGLRTSFTAK